MVTRRTTAFRDAVLQALDEPFAATGFARSRRAHAWNRPVDAELSHRVPLNFGLYEDTGEVSIIPTIPTVGVRYQSIELAVE
jgi:hypothetical protein